MSFPTGIIMAAGKDIPTGWVACDGSELSTSNAQYASLYELIGTTFGSGSGTFKVPDLRARVPAGVKATTTGTGLSGPISSWTGALNHTLSSSEVGEPGHTHTVTDPGHGHTPSWNSHNHPIPGYDNAYNNSLSKNSTSQTNMYPDQGAAGYWNSSTESTNVSFNSATPTISMDTSTAVSATSHTNHQPTLAVPYMIKL